jgi:hypothetical protein
MLLSNIYSIGIMTIVMMNVKYAHHIFIAQATKCCTLIFCNIRNVFKKMAFLLFCCGGHQQN